MPNITKRKIIDWIIILAVILSLPIVWYFAPRHKAGDVIVYNCSISEISPDYPIAVKEECRKLRADNLLNKPK